MAYGEENPESATPAVAAVAPAAAPAATPFWYPIRDAFVSVQKKVEAIQKADSENERLRLENAHLRLKLEALSYDRREKKAEKNTQEVGTRLKLETGSKLGRTLASMTYKPPMHLTPDQLHLLGLTYFKSREDEKAAVIFSMLIRAEDNEEFRTAENFLLAGISWYRLENLPLAERYFDSVIHSSHGTAGPVAGQAWLWKAVIAERQGNHKKSQEWLKEVLNQNPHSKEAAWVNSKEEANRAVASGK